MPPSLISVMRETLCSVGMMPESDFHWRDLLYTVCGCSLNGNAYVRFGTVPASDFHWRNLLYTMCGYAYGILIVRFGTAPVLLVHWTILRLRFVFPFGA